MCPAGFPEGSDSSNTPAGQSGEEPAAVEPPKAAGNVAAESACASLAEASASLKNRNNQWEGLGLKFPGNKTSKTKSIQIMRKESVQRSVGSVKAPRLVLTADLLVLGQWQQSNPGLPDIKVHLLLVQVKHVELDELTPQVPIQLRVHAHAVGLGVAETWVAAAVDGGGGVVWELQELEDHVGARLLRAPGLQVSAALHGDVELVPPAAGRLLQWRKGLVEKLRPVRR